MPKMHQMSPKLAALLAGLAVSTAAGRAANANPIPASTDDARALAQQAATVKRAVNPAPVSHEISTTDEARALAARSRRVSTTAPVKPSIVASTDEARAVAVAGSRESSVHATAFSTVRGATGSGGE